MRAADQVYAALTTARSLPGWTVTRLHSGTHRVTSPSGIAVINTDDPDAAEDALAELENLGLAQDSRHAPVPQPTATAPVAEQQVVPDPQPEPRPAAAPHEAPASTTEQEPPLVPTTTTRRRLTIWTYPDEPQHAPSLSAVMPEAFVGKGRCKLPSLIVTPEIAAAWLECVAGKNNRHLRPSNLDKFERIIEAHQFDHTHQGAAFNTEGECADSQHRLTALVNVAERNPDEDYYLVMDVTFNAPVSSAKHYDGGAPRDAKDRLNVEGLEGASAPLLRLLWQYEGALELNVTFKTVPTMTEAVLIDWGHQYSEDLLAHKQAVLKPLRDLKRNNEVHLNPNVATVVRYLAYQEWEHNCYDRFLADLAEPTAHKQGSPQRALVSWLRTNTATRGRSTDTQTVMAMLIIAYNDYAQNHGRTQMKWLPNQGMPRVYGGPDNPAPKKTPKKR